MDPEPSNIQKNYNMRKHVKNIVNKLAFQAMGYCGEYFDYSKWMPERFTACDMKDLLADW